MEDIFRNNWLMSHLGSAILAPAKTQNHLCSNARWNKENFKVAGYVCSYIFPNQSVVSGIHSLDVRFC